MIWQFIRKHYPVKGLRDRQLYTLLHFPKDLMKSRNYCLMNTTICSCMPRPVGFLWLHKVGLDRRVSKQWAVDEGALSVLVQPMLGDCGTGTGSQRWTAAWRWSATGFVSYSFLCWTSYGCWERNNWIWNQLLYPCSVVTALYYFSRNCLFEDINSLQCYELTWGAAISFCL